MPETYICAPGKMEPHHGICDFVIRKAQKKTDLRKSKKPVSLYKNDFRDFRM